MFIKFKITDASIKSCVVPFRSGTSSVLKVRNGDKLEVKEIEYAHLVEHCNKSKVTIEIIDAKDFKEVKEPAKDPVKEPLKEVK